MSYPHGRVVELDGGTNIIGKVGIDQVTANANEVVTKTGSVSTNSEIVSSTPTIYNIVMTLADTEYSQLLPDNTKRISANVQDGSSADNVRFAWETGKVATPTVPYLKFPQNVQVEESDLKLTTKTLYFASSIAGKTIQIQVWV